MKIGLTYDLREDYLALGYSLEETAEFDRPDTIEAIESALHLQGLETERIGHIFNLVQKLAQGAKWDLVFNIAEGLYGLGRESAVPALLDCYQIPYTFSDPLVMGLCLHKGIAKHIVSQLGVPTPDFAVIEQLADLKQLNIPYPLFVKPVAEGTSKGISAKSLVSSATELTESCELLLQTLRQPVIVESYLPGRELTVGVLGSGKEAKALGILEVHYLEGAEAHSYTYANKENCEQVIEYRLCEDEPLSSECRELALRVWVSLGCRDAGRVDFRTDAAGKPSFLEVNPLAGLNPQHSDLPILCSRLGISYSELISGILASAQKRCHEIS